MQNNDLEKNFRSYLTNMAGISEAHSDTLYESLEKADFPKGEMLLREGEVCRHSFFVEEGLLRSYTLGEDGKEHLIQFAPENWFIVDRGSVYFKDTSEIYIEAIEDSKVVLLDKNFMDRATQLDENFRKFNEKLLHNHIRHIQQRLNLLLSASAENRYLSFIETYPDLLLRVPQWMIASYLGITPESLSRVRKELAHRNS
ncbi:Crp/Fnr family transcriptional regulator [Aequorivita sp. H23M31]|uniref:Crp/Fnr family transcriptional regulator n=2 Tax=Aequorivita ciconiae TaxID=2494375 RepID=A0A410G189_9FLAO|nr:Crp/Fnr family transcriptional regulator [Aequorivita sp. H23M31]